MNAVISQSAGFLSFVNADMRLRTGTGSGIGERLAKVLSRLQTSNSGETAEFIGTSSVEASAPGILRILKASTGLSWNKIAELFNVSRRAVYDWLEGNTVSDQNYAKLLSVSEAIDILELSSAFQVRTFLLFHNEAGVTPFSLLKEGRYDEFQHSARGSTWAVETPKEELSGEFAFVSLVDRLTALQDTVHTDLPGKKRSKPSRRRAAD